jgi:hypothetical protein
MKITEHDNDEMSDFAPTRHEMLQIVKYWERVIIDEEVLSFTLGQVGRSEQLRISFADRRIDRICHLLGKAAGTEAINEVHAEYRDKDPRFWEAFLNGDEALRWSIHEDALRHMNNECSCSHVENPEQHDIDWQRIESEAALHRAGE